MIKTVLKRAILVVASLELTVSSLILLCVLVVWGTLYQVDNGIYAAQERFFSAWFTTIGNIIPFPAVKSIVALLSVNLLLLAIRKRPFSLRTIGIFILHIGVAMLVASSAITPELVQESAITLNKGQSTRESYDFANWELVAAVSAKGTLQRHRYSVRHLKQGQTIDLGEAGLFRLTRLYKNCSAMLSETEPRTVVALKEMAPSEERGRNFPGVSLAFTHANDHAGDLPIHIYGASEYAPTLTVDNYTISFSLMPVSLALPFSLTLQSFDVAWHPGTSKAKSFKSRLRVLGKNLDREVVVEMNRPFRFGAITVYQMSYNGQPGNYSTTLAIVRNPLRLLPYIASIVIVAGLLMHFLVKMVYSFAAIRTTRHDK